MNDVESLFVDLGKSTGDVIVEVGRRHTPYEFAYMKLSAPSAPEDCAVLWTQGIGVVSLDVAAGFGHFVVDEDGDDVEVREVLERYLQAALAYLAGWRSISRSRFLRVVTLALPTEEGELVLYRADPSPFTNILRF